MSTSFKQTASSTVPLYLLLFAMTMPSVGYGATPIGVSADPADGGSVAGIQDAMEKKTVAEEERRDHMLREIRIKRITLEKWYGAIEYGSGNEWKKVKQGFASAYFDLNDYFGKSVLAFNRDGVRQGIDGSIIGVTH
ncbi:MAG: hypothetical protein P8164_06785 [Gammaproteobacteria bacterium]